MHRSFRRAYLHKSVLPSLPPTWTCVNWASHPCELSHTRQNYLCEPLVRAMAGGREGEREDRLVRVSSPKRSVRVWVANDLITTLYHYFKFINAAEITYCIAVLLNSVK